MPPCLGGQKYLYTLLPRALRYFTLWQKIMNQVFIWPYIWIFSEKI